MKVMGLNLRWFELGLSKSDTNQKYQLSVHQSVGARVRAWPPHVVHFFLKRTLIRVSQEHDMNCS